jgi:cysteine-rich repeat protein
VAILFVAACTSSSNSNGVCGDGVLDNGEQCDDGNNISGDGCSASCSIETAGHCGDGHLDNGETCDDGNTRNGDGCSSTCQIESVCGDGNVTGREQCDDGNTTPNDGCSAACLTEYKTIASWHIKNAAGTAQPCPTGFDTAAVYSQAVDASGNPVGSPLIDLVSCADGTGTTQFIGNGTFRTWIEITNTNGSLTYAQTLAADVDLTAMNMAFDGDIVTDGGYFHWAWNLVGGTSGSALTCAQVSGLQGVEIISTLTGPNTSFDDQYTCTDGAGYSAALPMGSYSVSADAFSGSGSIGTAPTLTNQLIHSPNKVTDLGTIAIPIDGM